VQTAERPEFDAAMSQLCAGYNVPIGDRPAAYFLGLAKMSLGKFASCVEYALGEHGPDKLPTVPMIWAIYRKLPVAGAAPKAAIVDDERAIGPDNLRHFANRLLWHHTASRGGMGSQGQFRVTFGMQSCEMSPELRACREFTDALVTEWARYVFDADELATPAEFIRVFAIGINRLSKLEPSTRRKFDRWIADPKLQQPFPRTMADITAPTQQQFAA
jgi:hypothetical protein